MDHMKRIMSVLDIILPFVTHDPFRNTKRNADRECKVDDPFAFQAFVKRISTYQPEYWASAPNAAVYLARHGFVCTIKYQIECCGCKEKIEFEGAPGKKDIELVALKSHKDICKWKRVATPKDLFRIPSVPGKLYEDLKESWNELISLGPRLPKISYATLTTSKNLPDFVEAVLRSFKSDIDDIQTIALLLGLCGWVKGSKSSIVCKFCQRECATWNFFAVEDDGWTILSRQEKRMEMNNGENNTISHYYSLKVKKNEREKVHTSQQETNKLYVDGALSHTSPRENKETQSINSCESEATVKYRDSVASSNTTYHDSEDYSDGNDDGCSIYSEDSCVYISSNCSESPTITKNRRKSACISIQQQSSNFEKTLEEQEEEEEEEEEEGLDEELEEEGGEEPEEEGGEELEEEEGEDELEDERQEEELENYNNEDNDTARQSHCSNTNQEWSVDSTKEPFVEPEVSYYNEKHNNDTNYKALTDMQNDKNEDIYMNVEVMEQEGISSHENSVEKDKGQNLENTSNINKDFENKTCENITNIIEYTHLVSASPKSNISNHEKMQMENEVTADTLNEKNSDDKQSIDNNAADYQVYFFSAEEQFSSCNGKDLAITSNSFPKILSTRSLPEAMFNSSEILSTSKDEMSHLSKTENPEHSCPTSDINSSQEDLKDVVFLQVSEGYTESKDEYDLHLNKENTETHQCLSPVHDCNLYMDHNMNVKEQENFTHEEEKIENTGILSRQNSGDIYFVLLNKGHMQEDEEHEEMASSKLGNIIKDESLQEMYDKGKDSELIINDSECLSEIKEDSLSTDDTHLTEGCSLKSGDKLSTETTPVISEQKNDEDTISKTTSKCDSIDHLSEEEETKTKYFPDIQKKYEQEVECKESDTIEERKNKNPVKAFYNAIASPMQNSILESKVNANKNIYINCSSKNNIISEDDNQKCIAKQSSGICKLSVLTQVEFCVNSYPIVVSEYSKTNSDTRQSYGANKVSQEGTPTTVTSRIDNIIEDNLINEDENHNCNNSIVNIQNKNILPMAHNFCHMSECNLAVHDLTQEIHVIKKSMPTIIESSKEKQNDLESKLEIDCCSMNISDTKSNVSVVNTLEETKQLQESTGPLATKIDSPNVSLDYSFKDNKGEQEVKLQFINEVENDIFEDTQEELKCKSNISKTTEIFRKRKYEEIQETDETEAEQPSKVIKLEIKKTFFNPELEHRFWCIWRTKVNRLEYQNTAKKGWECALEIIQESLKKLEYDKILTQFQQYIRCMNTVDTWNIIESNNLKLKKN